MTLQSRSKTCVLSPEAETLCVSNALKENMTLSVLLTQIRRSRQTLLTNSQSPVNRSSDTPLPKSIRHTILMSGISCPGTDNNHTTLYPKPGHMNANGSVQGFFLYGQKRSWLSSIRGFRNGSSIPGIPVLTFISPVKSEKQEKKSFIWSILRSDISALKKPLFTITGKTGRQERNELN